MSDDFWAGAILASLIVGGGVYYKYKPSDEVPAPPEVGRYQIVNYKDTATYLLDTATGDTWRWVRMQSDYKKNSYGIPDQVAVFWEMQERFTDQQKEAEFVTSMRNADRILNAPTQKGKAK